MESLSLASPRYPIIGGSIKPSEMVRRHGTSRAAVLFSGTRRGVIGLGTRRAGLVVSAAASQSGGSDGDSSDGIAKSVLGKLEFHGFASISSSNSNTTSGVSGTPQVTVPPQQTYIVPPLFWIGVGVGLSALFSVVTSRLKRYAMEQAFKTMMAQPTPQSFSNAASFPASPFSFAAASPAAPAASYQPPVASQPVVTVDVPMAEVESAPSKETVSEIQEKPKNYAFVDVSLEEVEQKDSFRNVAKDIDAEKQFSPNGAAIKEDKSVSNEQFQSFKQSVGKSESVLSVDALEKMMEDPTVQKMVYPYLPEEMRNPTTFKWMLQNPQYRQQLQDMLNNMGGSSEWDNRMMESLKGFDLSSPEVKQQFDQIGLTPEEVISKIMANPDVAMAFQNPRVQAAIMDCSQNPLSIAKYQNDKEVMDVFNKISELFPGVTGSP